jgi:hypothetical protein
MFENICQGLVFLYHLFIYYIIIILLLYHCVYTEALMFENICQGLVRADASDLSREMQATKLN